jgi:hypothetical protein
MKKRQQQQQNQQLNSYMESTIHYKLLIYQVDSVK